MPSPARQVEGKRPRPEPKPRKPRIVYTVEILPGGDPERGEELLSRWLAEVLSE